MASSHQIRRFMEILQYKRSARNMDEMLVNTQVIMSTVGPMLSCGSAASISGVKMGMRGSPPGGAPGGAPGTPPGGAGGESGGATAMISTD